MGFPDSSVGKESTCNVGDPGLIPGLGRSPWRRKMPPTLVFLPGGSHGQRSLARLQSMGSHESDTTKHTQHSMLDYIAHMRLSTFSKDNDFFT